MWGAWLDIALLMEADKRVTPKLLQPRGRSGQFVLWQLKLCPLFYFVSLKQDILGPLRGETVGRK